MWLVLAFNVSLGLLSTVSVIYAQRTALPIALMYCVAAAGTYLTSGDGFSHFQTAGFCIDVLLLLSLTWIASTHGAHWPIASAALQIVTTLGHAARLVIPDVWPLAYWVMAQWTAWPSLILLAYGIYRERRAANT